MPQVVLNEWKAIQKDAAPSLSRRLRLIHIHKLYVFIFCVHSARVGAGPGNKASGEGSMLRRIVATATMAAGLG